MHVSTIMTRDVTTASPDMSIQEVCRLMAARDIGSLPIVSDRQPVGIVTDRDISIRAVAAGLPADTPLRRVMTPHLDTVADYQDVGDAVELMRKKQIRRIYVLDRDNWITGVVSLGDLALALDDQCLSGRVLKEISEPAPVHHH